MPQNTFDYKSTLIQLITWGYIDPDLCHHMASLVCIDPMGVPIYPQWKIMIHL